MSAFFEGPAGVPAFVKGLNTLLDAVAETKARLVLLSPIAHENLGRPLPDPTKHNAALALYRDAVRSIAGERNACSSTFTSQTLSAADYGSTP